MARWGRPTVIVVVKIARGWPTAMRRRGPVVIVIGWRGPKAMRRWGRAVVVVAGRGRWPAIVKGLGGRARRGKHEQGDTGEQAAHQRLRGGLVRPYSAPGRMNDP